MNWKPRTLDRGPRTAPSELASTWPWPPWASPWRVCFWTLASNGPGSWTERAPSAAMVAPPAMTLIPGLAPVAAAPPTWARLHGTRAQRPSLPPDPQAHENCLHPNSSGSRISPFSRCDLLREIRDAGRNTSAWQLADGHELEDLGPRTRT